MGFDYIGGVKYKTKYPNHGESQHCNSVYWNKNKNKKEKNLECCGGILILVLKNYNSTMKIILNHGAHALNKTYLSLIV